MGIEPILWITCEITYHTLSRILGSNIKPSFIHSLFFNNYRVNCRGCFHSSGTTPDWFVSNDTSTLWLLPDSFRTLQGSYHSISVIIEPPTGFEPVTFSLQMRCSTNWAKEAIVIGDHPIVKLCRVSFLYRIRRYCWNIFVSEVGLEPTRPFRTKGF